MDERFLRMMEAVVMDQVLDQRDLEIRALRELIADLNLKVESLEARLDEREVINDRRGNRVGSSEAGDGQAIDG